jgi:hypothetical protein
MKKIVLVMLLGFAAVGCVSAGNLPEVETEQVDDWFYPAWAAQAI